MTFITALSLIILTFLNRFVFKSFLAPSVLFSAMWSMFYFLYLLSGDLFFPISTKADLIFLLGALFFSIGSYFSIVFKLGKVEETLLNKRQQSFSNKLCFFAMIVLLAALPFYWKQVSTSAMSTGISNIWYAIRYASVQKQLQVNSVLNNAVPFSIIMAAVSFAFNDGKRKNKIVTFLLICISLVYNFLTVARAGLMLLLLTLFFIYIIKHKKIRIKTLILYLCLFIVSFSFAQVVLGKGSANTNNSLTENISAVGSGFLLYALGGMVAFNTVAENPDSIPSTGGTFRFFLDTANKLGANIDLPSNNAVFTPISTSQTTNVYTIYFYYFKDFGWIGVTFMMMFVGFVATMIYRNALRGKIGSRVFYGVFMSGICLTGFSENFWMQLDFLIKLSFVSLIIFYLPKIRIRTVPKKYVFKLR